MEHIRRSSSALPALVVAWILAGAVLGAVRAPAEPGTGFPRTEPLGLVVQLAEASEPLSLGTFSQSALILSGTPEGDLERIGGKLDRVVEESQQRLGGLADPREKAEGILSFLHERVLVRYDERQTRLDVLLDDGSYNCVSSGVLYALVAKSLGFEVWGVRTEDHAFCRIKAGARSFDVETTSPFGFDPGTRKEFTDSFGAVTGYTYVPPSSYGKREDIGERSLLGLILYNRTAFSSERRFYREAVPPAIDAYSLLGDRESYDRMIVSFLNLGSWYGVNREYSSGVDFVERMAERFPEPRLSSLLEDLLHNWTLYLLEQREFDAAENLLDAHRSRGLLADAEWKSLTVYLFQIKAQDAAGSDYAVAAGIIEDGLRKTGPDGTLNRSYEVYIHNRVVSLIRAGKLEDALVIIDDALEITPHSTLLDRDRSLVTDQMSTPR
jgi:tetratricopeptide (TPR) repeat protein